MKELALSEARYRALVEGSSDFLYVLDPDGHFTFAPAFHERRTGERATRRIEVRLRARDVEMDVRHFSISAHGRGGSFVGTHGVARNIIDEQILQNLTPFESLCQIVELRTHQRIAEM